jgi:Zn-dependent protease with chaperone function
MIQLRGKWHDGHQSMQIEAVMTVQSDGLVMVKRADTDALILQQPFARVRITPRLADTARFLTFEGGGTFETLDNGGVDQAQAVAGGSHWSIWVHRLETRLRYIIPAIVVFLLLAVVAVIYGVPAAARLIAVQLPPSVYRVAGEQTLTVLDRMIFKPSELTPEREQGLKAHLQPVLDHHAGLPVEIVFRKGGKVGPNAFALPDGTIIFTDEMVSIAQHDDEILAVLAHEIGHVVHHHGMRRIVQDSLVSFALLAITGDASGVSELFLGLPVILTELAYSRDFEREADLHALAYLTAHGIPTARFSDLLSRIDTRSKEAEGAEDNHWAGYLSTHPSTRERMEAFGGGSTHR